MTIQRRPDWLRRPIPARGKTDAVRGIIAGGDLHTVCREAKCPNCAECFAKGTATFLILGDICTRGCRFCSVKSGVPGALDSTEPARLLAAIREMGIRYAVITSVTRDDLPDGGAGVFAETIRLLRIEAPDVGVEVLVPDFAGSEEALAKVLFEKPDVFNHNIEAVERVFRVVRPKGDFALSLELLRRASEMAPEVPVKSGFMLGLGETAAEVEMLLGQLRAHGVSIVTMGQYLKPAAGCAEVVEYVEPDTFEIYRRHAESLGFAAVFSGPLVRSSYMAHEVFGRSRDAAKPFQEELP